MTVYTPDNQGRVHFGTLHAQTPQVRALEAIGAVVPGLEAELGFSVGVTAEAKADGFLWVEVLLPDPHYNSENSSRVGQALRNAARPFTELVYIETDSDASYAE